MQTVSLFNAKTHLSRIVDQLITGEEDEVIISRHGKPVARIAALQPKDVSRRIGIARGKFTIPEEFEAINADVERLFAAEGGGGYAVHS